MQSNITGKMDRNKIGKMILHKRLYLGYSPDLSSLLLLPPLDSKLGAFLHPNSTRANSNGVYLDNIAIGRTVREYSKNLRTNENKRNIRFVYTVGNGSLPSTVIVHQKSSGLLLPF
jgi:hypothetical protein